MPIGGKKDNKSWIYLDERECFALWNRLSSLGKTREALIEKGVKNPKTEKPPTKMSISVAAKRFIIKNPELIMHNTAGISIMDCYIGMIIQIGIMTATCSGIFINISNYFNYHPAIGSSYKCIFNILPVKLINRCQDFTLSICNSSN